MPRALMVSSSFLPGRGGIESYLAELCDELAPHLVVFAQATRDGKPLPADLSYPTIGYPGSTVVPTRRLAAAIARTARTAGTDRILFGTPWPLVLLGPRLKALGLRYAVIVHGAEMLVPSAVPRVAGRLAAALSEADLLLPVSEFTRAKLDAYLRAHDLGTPPVDVLRAKVDVARFAPEFRSEEVRRSYGAGDETRILLCFGRLVRRKGIDRLIAALDAIAEAAGPVTLVVAGTGPERKRLERAAASSVTPVVFAGRVPEEDAPGLYASADVFVLPVSDRWRGLETEGLGVVLLEAAASGVPCVTGVSGGTPEAVIDGATGYVVDATDRPALVNRTVELLSDRERAKEMGLEGRRFVTDVFANRALPSRLVDWLGLTQQ